MSAQPDFPIVFPSVHELTSQLLINGYDIKRFVFNKKYKVTKPDGSVHTCQNEREFADWAATELQIKFGFRPEPVTRTASGVAGDNLAGIGGWLILWAIGLLLTIAFGAVGTVQLVSVLPRVNAATGGTVFMHIIFIGALTIFTAYAAVCFFRKKAETPILMKIFLVVNTVISVLLLLADSRTGIEASDVKNLVTSIVACAIWIPYFNKSKRVTATFVN